MSEFLFMPGIEILRPRDWRVLRNLRLSALLESPHLFLSTYERERGYTKAQWQAEFERGTWHAGRLNRKPISLLGVTKEPETPFDECYLEYLWVSPGFRRSGVAFNMLAATLQGLRASGIRTVRLWVLDGNDIAVHLYRRVGFVPTNHRQELEERPGRSEEQMILTLG